MLVLATIPSQSPLLLSISSVGALLLAWAALRIMWTEVLQTRREHQTDRAAQAATYKSLFAERAADHAEFTTAMTSRLAEAQMTQRELEGELISTQRQQAETLLRAETAETALIDAITRVADLTEELDSLQAAEQEALDELASEKPSVEQLVAWAEKTKARHRDDSPADIATA